MKKIGLIYATVLVILKLVKLPLNKVVRMFLNNKLCNQLSKAIRNQLHNQIAMDCHLLTTYTILLIAMASHLLPI